MWCFYIFDENYSMIAIYARISQEKDDLNNSIDNQIHFGKDYAKSQKIDFEIYCDIGISGTWEIEQRPELLRLVHDVIAKKITHVFAYDQSRLERNSAVWSNLYFLFQRNNIKLHYHLDGDFDFTSDNKFLTSSILSVFNSFFVKLTKTKVKNALLKNAENGKVHASPPFGYTKDSNKLLVIDKDEAEVVRRIYDMSLHGRGTDKIAEILNSDGVKTSYNKGSSITKAVYKVRDKYSGNVTERKKSDAKWRGKTIQGIIKNTIYKGQRFWQNNYYPAPAIISESYWQEVNDNLKNNRNNTGKKVEHKYILRGIIKCNCGRNMYGRSRVNKRDHTYICSSKRFKEENCGNRAINIDKIENFVWEHFFVKTELLKLLNDSSNDKEKLLVNLLEEKRILQVRIEEARRGKVNLIKAVANGSIDEADIKSEMDLINQNVIKHTSESSRVEKRILEVENFENLLVDTRTDFELFSLNAGFETKKNLIHKYIHKIVVAYDNRLNIPRNNYHIQIEFKNNIVQENYIFNSNDGTIISLREKGFKRITDSGIIEIMDFKTFQNSTIFLNDGSFLVKPFLGIDDKTIFFKNIIFPYGDIKTWEIKKIVDFYTINGDFLSKNSGINIHTEDKNDESYNWYVSNYRNFHQKPLEEWVKFLYDKFQYANLKKSKDLDGKLTF